LPNDYSQTLPLVIGHRGASALAPENTLIAFETALADGAAGIELDVRLARDGVPVVIHDSTLRRTGLREEAVASLASSELGQIDVGSWFNRAYPQKARADYSRQFVSTLDQVFDLLSKRHIRSKIAYVEMKTDNAEDTSLELARSVVQSIKRHHLQSQVVVVSFNLRAVAHIKTVESFITTGASFEPLRHPLKIFRGQPIVTDALECGASQILLHRLVATRCLLELAAENQLRPVIWTVDDPRWVRRRASFSIYAVITNNPGEMTRAIAGND